MIRPPPSLRTLAVACLAATCMLLPPIAHSQNEAESVVARWFSENRSAERYADVRKELTQVFTAAEAGELPLSVLEERLSLGAAKRVPPERLTEVLRLDLKHLSEAVAVLRNSSLPSDGEAARDLFVYIRGGVPADTLAAVAEAGARGVPGDRRLRLNRTAAAVLAMYQTDELTEADMTRIGSALMNSSLPSTAFMTVASLYSKARLGRVETQEAIGILYRVLTEGGGLVHLQRELERRMKRR